MIRLDNEYCISSDGVQYLLQRTYMSQPKDITKEPRETTSIEGYFSNLQSCAKGYYNKKIKTFVSTSEEQTFKEVLDYMYDLESQINNLLSIKINKD